MPEQAHLHPRTRTQGNAPVQEQQPMALVKWKILAGFQFATLWWLLGLIGLGWMVAPIGAMVYLLNPKLYMIEMALNIVDNKDFIGFVSTGQTVLVLANLSGMALGIIVHLTLAIAISKQLRKRGISL